MVLLALLAIIGSAFGTENPSLMESCFDDKFDHCNESSLQCSPCYWSSDCGNPNTTCRTYELFSLVPRPQFTNSWELFHDIVISCPVRPNTTEIAAPGTCKITVCVCGDLEGSAKTLIERFEGLCVDPDLQCNLTIPKAKTLVCNYTKTCGSFLRDRFSYCYGGQVRIKFDCTARVEPEEIVSLVFIVILAVIGVIELIVLIKMLYNRLSCCHPAQKDQIYYNIDIKDNDKDKRRTVTSVVTNAEESDDSSDDGGKTDEDAYEVLPDGSKKDFMKAKAGKKADKKNMKGKKKTDYVSLTDDTRDRDYLSVYSNLKKKEQQMMVENEMDEEPEDEKVDKPENSYEQAIS